MSFAIIQTGGKQYKVKASEILKIEQLENLKPESKIEFNQILAYGDDKNIEVGSPLIKGAKVNAAIKAIGYANIREYPHLKKKPSEIPVFTATTTPLIITLIPKDIKIINKGWAYFLLIILIIT